MVGSACWLRLPRKEKHMSSAIKAMIQHQAALAQINEMHRHAVAYRRSNSHARPKHHSRSSLAARVLWLRLALKGEGA
jgi:hypothetical protein